MPVHPDELGQMLCLELSLSCPSVAGRAAGVVVDGIKAREIEA